MTSEKKKKRNKAHSMSDSSDHETETNYLDESYQSSSGKQEKKKKYKTGIPLFSMDDFSDLTSTVPKIKFPSDLKVRHPLFGIDFEGRVGLAAPRKKKKSKSKQEAVKQEIFSGSEGEITPKKKKSRIDDLETVKRIKYELSSPSCSDSDARVKKKSRKSCGD